MIRNISIANLEQNQGFIVYGNPNSRSGGSVNSAGDVNGDGYDDVVILAQNTVCAYVIYGGSPLYSNISLGELAGQGFSICGYSNAFSGCGADINNNNYSDIIVGNPYLDISKAGRDGGVTFVTYGNKTLVDVDLTKQYDFIIYSSNANDHSGWSVSNAGDINDDGIDDIIIGAPYANNTAGISYIIYGNKAFADIDLASLSVQQGCAIYGVSIGDWSGYSVSGAGDVNGDGYDDVIIGAPQCNPYEDNKGCINKSGTKPGISYVVYGGKALSNILLINLDKSQGFIVYGISYSWTGSGLTGFSVSTASNINGDYNNITGYAFDDIIIGAPYATLNTNKMLAGASYVIYGGTDINEIYLDSLSFQQGFVIWGAANGDNAGYSVSGAGDVNGDRLDDVIIGAPLAPYSSNHPGTGISYIVFGKNNTNVNMIDLLSLSSSQGFAIIGDSNNDFSGGSVSGAGDINNDSFADVIIGAYAADYFAGQSYVIYGAASGFTTDSPTSSPTVIPTKAPTQQKPEFTDTIYFKYLVMPVVSALSSFLLLLCVRKPLSKLVLDYLGYGYELLYSDNKESLSAGKVGFRLFSEQDTNNEKIICKIKDKYFNLEIDDSSNNGISERLYQYIFDKLKKPHDAELLNLLQSEKNQIRDFLISHKHIQPTKICCLEIYTDLGYFRGSIYGISLQFFREEHEAKYQYEIRSGGGSVSLIVNGYTDIATDDLNEELLQADRIESNSAKIGRMTGYSRESDYDGSVVSGFGDLGKEISRQNSRTVDTHSVIGKSSCVLMSIDALMDPEHVRLQNEEFIKFGNQLADVSKEFTASHNKLLAIEGSLSSSNNIDYSSIGLFTQQTIEYAPTIRYFFKVCGINLPQIHLSNEVWTGIHFAAGVVKTRADSFLYLGQMIESGAYYAKLVLYDKLAEANTYEQPTDLVTFTKACSQHIIVGGGLGLASGAPVYGTINGAAMCLNQHQMLEETFIQSGIRYGVDIVTGVLAIYSLANQNVLTQVVGVVSAVSMSDITTKVSMASIELVFNGVSSMFEDSEL